MQAAQVDPRWITYINALSTAAVAFFALVELLRGRAERLRREGVATARIAVIGENLERMIRTWNEHFPVEAAHRTDRNFNVADRAALEVWLSETVPEFPTAQDQMLRLVDDSADAPSHRVKSVQSASVKLWSAMGQTRTLKRLMQDGPPEAGRQYARRVRDTMLEAERLWQNRLLKKRRFPLLRLAHK